MALNKPAAGARIKAADVTQFTDIPDVQAFALGPGTQVITAGAYAALPTPIAASLTLTRTTLIALTFGGRFGSGTIGTPTNSAQLGAALSGVVTDAASNIYCLRGSTPGVQDGGIATRFILATAGTLTATLQAFSTGSMSIRDLHVELTAIRAI